MPKINILDKSVYSLIAAGEVIDKPASVVKELLENSVDAGANNITIEIKNGGIDYIRVTDNGCGIEENELSIAFMPHTTSKIKNATDLYNIGTLGFRGEALSTITAVSKVTMISRTNNSSQGNIIKINGGDIELQEPIGSAVGTTVICEDLFYNIPARRKFLRKYKSEESDITNIISRIILSNPNLSIKYIVNNKTIYNSSGNGMFDAIYAIYGKDVVNNLIPVHIEKEYIKIDGYIGKTSFTKPNRTYQTLIVNGRYVINQTISSAIFKAYENYIMKNNFPFYILNVRIDNSMVDVNVHPNKLDVKFSNSNELYELFVCEISKILLETININNLIMTNNESEESSLELNLDNLQILDSSEGYSYTSQNQDIIDNIKVVEVEIDANDDQPYDNIKTNNMIYNTMNAFNQNDDMLTLKSPSEIEVYLHNIKQSLKENQIEKDSIDEQISFSADVEANEKMSIDFKIVGTIFDTYIIVEKDDYIYLIDQHAGHERILYDKYCKEVENFDICTQSLLVPYILKTNIVEHNYIEENLDILTSLGFEINDFGHNSFRITAIPLSIKDININTFFEDILSNIGSKIKSTTTELLKEYLAKTACRHAIKANDKIDYDQIAHLLSLLDNTPVLLCPHGRPIILKITEKEIEKWFKRIV